MFARTWLVIGLAALAAACEDDGLGGVDGGSGAADVAAAGPIDGGSGRDAAAPGDDATAPCDDGARPPDASAACDGGVTTSALTTADSSATVSGRGPASTVGEVTVTSTGGATLQVPVSTDGAGAWSIDVPLFCGLQTVVVAFPGASCAERAEVTVQRTGCRTADVQIALSWDAIGLDFELHLVRPGGRINDDASDCTWTSCISSAPDWGVVGDPADDPHKDIDNTGNFGPENIYLSFPEAGLYTVMVEHWGSGGAGADGEVTILLAGGAPVIVPITDLPSHFTRAIATIDWASRTVTPLTAVYDCTATWSSGCREPIP